MTTQPVWPFKRSLIDLSSPLSSASLRVALLSRQLTKKMSPLSRENARVTLKRDNWKIDFLPYSVPWFVLFSNLQHTLTLLLYVWEGESVSESLTFTLTSVLFVFHYICRTHLSLSFSLSRVRVICLSHRLAVTWEPAVLATSTETSVNPYACHITLHCLVFKGLSIEHLMRRRERERDEMR